MSKHTPGPWSWSDKYQTAGGEPTWSLVGEGGYGILSCDGLANSPSEFHESNARLIAAAPDLLEALEKVLATTSSADMDYFALEMANAAIAKARGES